ncbi:TIGR03643 family protein [Francisella tularensis subsp. novicida FSC159]|uniref:TIGR03643 family protein n=1 Tax=Francisella tularensis TaxID=263 RepID=UPI0002FFCB79|nr:TIGR03643 family protein [Francisella tularensis]AJI73019.1 hypothetical protein AQ14_504 [Francisella tularensis subsp. novicida D9876]MBK2112219.1 TIGR03643 family protein [Francisella tularensis subsp. novicida FSC159]
MNDKSITTSEVIEMAWCDKTSFDAIKEITGLSEPQVIKIMRNNLKPSSFKLWRKRVAKHQKRLNHINADSLV